MPQLSPFLTGGLLDSQGFDDPHRWPMQLSEVDGRLQINFPKAEKNLPAVFRLFDRGKEHESAVIEFERPLGGICLSAAKRAVLPRDTNYPFNKLRIFGVENLLVEPVGDGLDASALNISEAGHRFVAEWLLLRANEALEVKDDLFNEGVWSLLNDHRDQ